jgi:aminoglycoside phosphotransferase (APT) family kinase protein
MAYYRDYHDWVTQEFDVPTLDATWNWLVAHRPEERGEVVLNWGDSRIGNIIWQDFTCAAVLDWEMATLGQPEMDLGWWLYFDRQFSEGLGMPRPTGFPSHEETIDRYADLIGRPLGDLFFYEVFSGYRFGVIMARLSDLLIDSDILPHESDMATNNFATQLLAKMLDFPAPA